MKELYELLQLKGLRLHLKPATRVTYAPLLSCRTHHVSGRRVVHGFSDVIRRFHVHNVTEDNTVFWDSTVML